MAGLCARIFQDISPRKGLAWEVALRRVNANAVERRWKAHPVGPRNPGLQPNLLTPNSLNTLGVFPCELRSRSSGGCYVHSGSQILGFEI